MIRTKPISSPTSPMDVRVRPTKPNAAPPPATLPFAATVGEAVRLSGLSRTALYALLGDGVIEGRKRGRTTLILMDSVRRYVDALPRAEFGAAARGR